MRILRILLNRRQTVQEKLVISSDDRPRRQFAVGGIANGYLNDGRNLHQHLSADQIATKNQKPSNSNIAIVMMRHEPNPGPFHSLTVLGFARRWRQTAKATTTITTMSAMPSLTPQGVRTGSNPVLALATSSVSLDMLVRLSNSGSE